MRYVFKDKPAPKEPQVEIELEKDEEIIIEDSQLVALMAEEVQERLEDMPGLTPAELELVAVEEAGPKDLAAADIESVTSDGERTTVEYTDGDELTAPAGSLSVEDVKPEKPKRKSSGSKKKA